MADLVLGLAKSAVEGTLTMAKSAIEEEVKLKKSMQRDLLLISDEFEMMHSFLNVAKERATDEMVRTLVRQVRNMALDVEDCIESVVLVDAKSHWWRRFLTSCMLPLSYAPAAALDDAVAAAELLKSRIEAMGQRNQRYWHIRDDSGSSKSKFIEKTNQQAVANAAAVGILKEARNAKKKDGGSTNLAELIKNKDDVPPLQVISVWGAAGDLGVASIIKKAHDNPEICSKFTHRAWVKLTHPFNPHEFMRGVMAQFSTNCQQGSPVDLPKQTDDDVPEICSKFTRRAWVKLTQSFNPHEFMRGLMAQFSTNCQQGSPVNLPKQTDAMMGMEGILLTEEFAKQVSNNRYLIFLEDLSSTVDWEAVKMYLPDKKNGSCIVVHTQQLEVASLCVGQSHRIMELERFSDDHSVCVFFNEKRSQRYLIDLINKKDDVHAPLQVISVCGEDDGHLEVAMASIINKTCGDEDNPEICKKFRYRAWVKLRHPFSEQEFIFCLLAQLCTNYCLRHGSAQDFMKLNDLGTVTEGVQIKELAKQVMSDQRYI